MVTFSLEFPPVTHAVNLNSVRLQGLHTIYEGLAWGVRDSIVPGRVVVVHTYGRHIMVFR